MHHYKHVYLGHIPIALVRQTTHNSKDGGGGQLPLSEGVGEGDVSSDCSTYVGLGVGSKSGDMAFKRGCLEPVGEIVL